jgi:hypothetical protein
MPIASAAEAGRSRGVPCGGEPCIDGEEMAGPAIADTGRALGVPLPDVDMPSPAPPDSRLPGWEEEEEGAEASSTGLLWRDSAAGPDPRPNPTPRGLLLAEGKVSCRARGRRRGIAARSSRACR